jgi:plastocyanin
MERSMIRLVRRLLPTNVIVLLCLLAPLPTRGAEGSGTIAGEIRVTKGGKAKSEHGNVVVYIEGAPKPKDVARKHVIRQRDVQFDPRTSVIVKGTTVEFPNEDKIFHNVFSASRPARFDLGLYRSGTSKSVEFRREGVVDIFCNIHPEMISRVVVVPNEFFTVTDAAGKFRIEGLPPGKYPVVAMPAYGEPVRTTLEVAAGKTATLAVEVVEGDKPTQHRRKDGTPYGRYE